jgi:hypothetical protein
MACERITMPNGGSAIVCGRPKRHRCKCGKPATLLCDWKEPSRKSGTCDAPICEACSTSPAPGKDVCPKHAPELAAWLAREG